MQIKDWNFLVYLTSDNDLYRFAGKNLSQMAQIGSTPYINIIVQWDVYGKKEVTRYFVEQNNLVHLDTQITSPESQIRYVANCVLTTVSPT